MSEGEQYYEDKTVKDLVDIIVKEVTKEDALDIDGLRYYVQDIIGVADGNGVAKEELLKVLSKQSTVNLKDLRKLYADEKRLMNNESARSTAVPPKYLSLSNKILGMLLSPSIEVKNAAQELLVKEFLKENHVVTTRNDSRNEVWIYDDGIYVQNGVSYVKEFCRMILGQAYHVMIVNNVIAKIEADTFVDEDVFFNQQNNYPYLIPVRNGLLNVKERRISSFDPKRYFFNKVNAEFKLDQDCPKIKDFFRSVVGSDEDVEGLREFIGYCLVKKYNYAKSLMLEGDGSNGKTTMIKLITEFLGEKNISSVKLHNLDNDRFSKAMLHNKLANLVPDIGAEDLTTTDSFRSLTGNDPVQADRKFKSSISFVNYAKMIFGANKIPMPKDDVDAFFRRWIIIRFPYKFVPASEVEAYKDRGGVFARDNDLLQKILGDAELSGFLNWVLDGYHNVEVNGDFTNTKSTFEVKLQWTRMSNSFAAFFMDEVQEASEDVLLSKSDLHRAYVNYCKGHGLKPISQSKINQYMLNEQGAFETRVRLLDGERPSAWVGFSFIRGAVVVRGDHKFSVKDYEVGVEEVQLIVPSGGSVVVEEDVKSPWDCFVEFVGDGEVSIELVLKELKEHGVSELDLDKWSVEGKVVESRAGFVRLNK